MNTEARFNFIVNHVAIHSEFGPGIINTIEDNNVTFLSKVGEQTLNLFLAFKNGTLRMFEAPIQKRLLDNLYESNGASIINSCNRKVYYVFQGKSYDNERRFGYIWAPANKGIHHWDRLKELKPGDIIFHGAYGAIQALSEVIKAPYYDTFPFNPIEGIGHKVDCRYYPLQYPIVTKSYCDEIKKYAGYHTPFNKNGTGNQGYLFELNLRLAQYFLGVIVRYNPDVKNLKFLDGLINFQ